MHELTITQNIIEIATSRAAQRKILRIQIEVGALMAIDPEILQFCFHTCARGTNIEGAILEISVIDGLGECKVCGAITKIELLHGRCRCGSGNVQCIAGEELTIREMELAGNV